MAKRPVGPDDEEDGGVDGDTRLPDDDELGEAEPIDEADLLQAEQDAERLARDQAARQQELISVVLGRLDRLATETEGKRQETEERWLDDLRQFHGRYDLTTEAVLKQEKRSRLFVNMTRPKVHSWEARLTDLLFPTSDDKNWGIKPTPIPEGEEGEVAPTSMQPAAPMPIPAGPIPSGPMPSGPQPGMEGGGQTAALDQTQQPAPAMTNEDAKVRASAMEKRIEDQLRECGYNQSCRDMIHTACVMGTGLIKGPVLAKKNRRRWRRGPDGQQALVEVEDSTLAFSWVDPWHFYPDMSARTLAEAGFTFEDHLLTEKGLKDLKRLPGINLESLRALIEAKATSPVPNWMTQVREITGLGGVSMEPRYRVREYHGPMEREEIRAFMVAFGQDPTKPLEDIDPLEELNVILWFCGTHMLKFGLHPMERGDSLYSAFNLVRDEGSVFGFGIPALMSNSQAALNAAWRMMMDNSGLTAGPQVVIDKSKITPVDGSWGLTARKVWLLNQPLGPGEKAMDFVDINGHQAELANIIVMAREFSDDETSMPLIAQGEQAAHITRTAGGMALLMNSANVIFRLVVRNFDDDATVPCIRRAYDWNMQFSDDESIKGDFEVDARGSSVLMVRDMQAQNLTALAVQFGGNPMFAPLLKPVPLARQIVASYSIAPDDIIKTDEEIEADAEAAKANPPPPPPEMMKLQAELQIAQIQADAQREIAWLNHETAMMQVAAEQNLGLDKVRAMLQGQREEIAHKERSLAAEIAVQSQPGFEGSGGGGTV